MIFRICPNEIYNLIGGCYYHTYNNYRKMKWNCVAPTIYIEQTDNIHLNFCS